MFFGHVSAQKEGSDVLAIKDGPIPEAVLLTEDFNFMGALSSNGWSAHSGTNTNPPATTTGLTYSGYQGSGVGNAALIGNAAGEDVNRPFSMEQNVDGSTVYFSTLVNVNEAASSKTGDYILHIGNRVAPDNFTFFAARVFARVVNDAVNFGLSNTSTATYGTTNLAKNTTYLLIVKYTINAAGNDTTSLWVFPSGVPSTEAAAGTPEVLNTTTAGQDVINAIALRQGSSTTQPQAVVDAIRVGTTWSDIAGGGGTPTPTPTATATPSPTPTATPTPMATPVPSAPKKFRANLNGTNEVPPNASTALGYGSVILNAAENMITVSVYYRNLSSGVTGGHIHGPAAAGVNAAIIFDLTPQTGQTSGSVTNRQFAVSPAQVADLRAGLWYFNIHTTNFPNGEIRGQIKLADAPSDFNGDGKTDFGVVRPTAGAGGTQLRWFVMFNGEPAGGFVADWGVTSDIVTPADYDGDGRDDIAVWRAAGDDNSSFYILHSGTNTIRITQFGTPGDDPSIVRDYDGDGKDDLAIYRRGATDTAQSNFWYLGSHGTRKDVQIVTSWGLGSDTAVPGDYNGDGIADFCVYRNTENRGFFWVHFGTGGFDAPGNDLVTQFGLAASDAVVPGDYDGDGITDFAVSRFQGANIVWFYLPSSGGNFVGLTWGRNASDQEVQGDYDGDGKTDIAVYRSLNTANTFYVLKSSGGVLLQNYGLFGDFPTAAGSHIF